MLYDTLNREDLNWRKYHEQVTLQTVRHFRESSKKALVVDDSVIQRFGKKMPGISSHFDHTSGRHVMGQQVLMLGFSCEDSFVTLDSELFTSQTNAQSLPQPFKDGRSTAGKRYRVAKQQSKPEMVGNVIRRARRAGVQADYLLADAWFGSKAMIRLCQETDLIAIVRMKKGKLKYRVSQYTHGKLVHREMDVKALYQASVRQQ